jgi:hypothetical protein
VTPLSRREVPPGLAGIASRPGKGLPGFPDGQGLAEMPREERDLAGLVQFPEAEPEDVRAFRASHRINDSVRDALVQVTAPADAKAQDNQCVQYGALARADLPGQRRSHQRAAQRRRVVRPENPNGVSAQGPVKEKLGAQLPRAPSCPGLVS